MGKENSVKMQKKRTINVSSYTVNALRHLFFPANCNHCGKFPQYQNNLCKHCSLALNEAAYMEKPANICPRCKIPQNRFQQSNEKKSPHCEQCFDREIFYDSLSFLYSANDDIRTGLSHFKFRGQTYILSIIEEQLQKWMESQSLDYTAWVPVPVGPATMQERGFNQVELLFATLSNKIPKSFLFYKQDIREMHHRGRESRFMAIPQAYQVFPKERSASKNTQIEKNHRGNILLVDDFITSGATVNYLAYLLKKLGFAQVGVLAIYFNG